MNTKSMKISEAFCEAQDRLLNEVFAGRKFSEQEIAAMNAVFTDLWMKIS